MVEETTDPILGERYQDALTYAAGLHRRQVRKGTLVPYVSHLLSVSALVLEHGGNEDEGIAALLHDAVEDQGGRDELAEIRHRFGDRVAHIVEGCSDAFVDPKPPWRDRKEAYLRHLHDADDGERLVSCADKLHNARSIVADLRTSGAAVWERFNKGREDQLWYYTALRDEFVHGGPDALAAELSKTVDEMCRLAGPT